MTTFLSAVFLLILGFFGLAGFFAVGSLFLLALAVGLAALTFLPAPWDWYGALGALAVQVAWIAYVESSRRRNIRAIEANTAPYLIEPLNEAP